MTRTIKPIYYSLFLLMLVIILARFLPHVANFSPIIAIALLSPRWFEKKLAILFSVFALLVSDVLIAYQFNTPIFGSWTLFTYSGLALIFSLGTRQKNNSKLSSNILMLLSSSLGYWAWTNLGVWLLASIYPLTITGLMACYTAAIPFLKNAVLGDVFWFSVIAILGRSITVRIDASRLAVFNKTA